LPFFAVELCLLSSKSSVSWRREEEKNRKSSSNKKEKEKEQQKWKHFSSSAISFSKKRMDFC
jgi:hypothetical protein